MGNEADNKYRQIFENVQDVYYRTDLNGIITEISPSIKRYSNYFDKDVIGKPIANFYANPDDRLQLIQEIQEKGEAADFEILLKGKNDVNVWTSVNAHFTFDENGQIEGVEGSLRDLTERKQAEEKSELALSLLQATLDSTADGILVVDLSGKITSYNKQFRLMFNHSQEILDAGEDSAIIESVLSLIKDPDLFVSKVQFLYDHPESESYDTIEFKDGRILERYSCPQRLDDEPIARVWNFRDVTVRKKYEEQLQLMAHTLKSINESISITNTGNQILFVNDAFLKTYGYTHENELIGKNISIVRSLDNDPEFADKILKITTDTGWQGEILNRKKDGTEFPISLSTSVVQNEKGETLGMVGVAVDISERKQTEKALQESELKYRNLIETMPDGFYRSTPEGKFLEINEAMVKMLGYGSKEELLAVDIKTQLYFKPEDRESRVLQENPLELDVYPLKKKDGSAVWVEDHGWYVKDKAENIIYHEGVSRDITDRKTSEMQLQRYSEELQELNASKDKFFSIIAHDLKTPFNSILGFSEILKDEARNLDIETIEQYAGIINSTSKNTFRLLENLLDWARIQQSQILFRPVPVILNKLVGEVVEMLVENANSKLITIINHIPENLIIMADEDMLKTILRNLLSNALKFTSVNGKVEIKSASAVHSIEISVEDDGAGIKQEDIGKIFKIGAGFSKRGTGNEKGTGLGLMLCKEFVEKHGGKIWVKSEEGKGSTFTFSINENG
jgi:PAS domain S-box-containing protein